MASSCTLSHLWVAQSQLVPAHQTKSQGGIPGMPWEGSGYHPGHTISRMESLSFTGNPSFTRQHPRASGRGSFLLESWKPSGPGLSWAEGQGMITVTSWLGREPGWPSGHLDLLICR